MPGSSALDLFHPVVREWFTGTFPEPTLPQQRGWPAIARGESTLILAPTGTGKTLTAFLWCLNRLMFEPPRAQPGCRVIYVSPLKALAFDVERNLRVPLAGIAAAARARGVAVHEPRIAARTGDTPANERARFRRNPADILITTPESLFLLLTSTARERLRTVDTVIIDEIHALVAGKRGAHLALSMERLEVLCAAGDPAARPSRPGLQRIGLSATQRPLDEVARFLGGAEPRADAASVRHKRPLHEAARHTSLDEDAAAAIHDEFADTAGSASAPDSPDSRSTHVSRFRPVTIVDASGRKPLALRVELPSGADATGESPAALPGPGPRLSPGLRSSRPDPRSPTPDRRSLWASIHPRLLDLIRSHRSTLLFVNSRRLAERLAGTLNELAARHPAADDGPGPLVRAHHGSLSRETRNEVEDLLKAGRIRALVATSSLELGIDMGAIDLVVQVEAPPSVASGLQRIGRAGHQVDATSEGVIFPKFRGDLVACAAVVRAMHEGRVEATRYPRNPLDVLAQQIVAAAGVDTWDADALFDLVRGAAPFADLSRAMFDGVLDMLSGRYPSDEFAELRPRITWDRIRRTIAGRQGAARVAIANAGTIPDRGLYGVFLAGAAKPTRVGELDEEMVFETKPGEVFTLGASSWRAEEITHDRVLVSPAPGEPGKMPFWHGDRAGRPIELGLAIGKLARDLRAMPRPAAVDQLVRRHDLDANAAGQVLRYLDDQAAAGAVPDDRTIVIERCLDELGDWRVCVLSPLGSRIHAPWAMAATAHIRARTGMDVEVMWGDEGFVVRFGDVEAAPDPALLLPDAADVERLLVRQLGGTSLFAARFREAAARALLLPRRRPGTRTPLWLQRKRAADLLAVASRFGSFPILLETYRELLRDHFDLPALTGVLGRVADRSLRVAVIDSTKPSPFAASLLFSYVANYIYDGDAPLAERRAQVLSVDQAQLRELVGDAALRELLDPEAIETCERRLQHLEEGYRVRHADGIHDLLLRIGDLSLGEIAARSTLGDVPHAVDDLEHARRLVRVSLAGAERCIAVEDAARYRDALGVRLPPDLPAALLEPVRDPGGDLVRRYARSHGPFTVPELATRYGLAPAAADALLARAARDERLIEGEFRPGRIEREWVDADVLRSIRQQSLARLRREIEPVEPAALGRFLRAWHGIGLGRRGVDALLDAIEQLQGAAVPASVLERQILPARIDDYQPALLDTLMAAGEVTWTGVEPLGERDGRVALYLADHAAALRAPRAGLRDPGSPLHTTPAPGVEPTTGQSEAVVAYLREHGASFFAAIHQGTGGGFPGELVATLWRLVWSGLVTNDTLHPLRALVQLPEPRTSRRPRDEAFRSRRLIPPTAEGRWALVAGAAGSTTEWAAAVTRQLLARHGVVTREIAASEAVSGGFSMIYQVLKAMEDAGRIRRGYFVAGLGGAQFAMPTALDLLRSHRDPPAAPATIVLAATDPANPYGTVVTWPGDASRAPARAAGAIVILVDGHAAAYLPRNGRELLLFAPDAEPGRAQIAREVARMLRRLAGGRDEGQRGILIATINGEAAAAHPLASRFVEAGFLSTAMGLQAR